MFGMGTNFRIDPTGHPLLARIGEATMNAIIESRFEGPTTETLPSAGQREPAAFERRAASSSRRTWLMASVAATAGLLAAGTHTARAASAQPRPFQTLVSGSIQGGPSTFQLSGSGVAGQLGASQHGGPVQITGVDPDTGVITDTLTETFTANDGSTLTLLCQQIATPVSPGSLQFQSIDQWVAVGGTRRFAGVTGSGGGSTFVDLAALTYVKQCTGTLTY
jgi:hypothetical protein